MLNAPNMTLACASRRADAVSQLLRSAKCLGVTVGRRGRHPASIKDSNKIGEERRQAPKVKTFRPQTFKQEVDAEAGHLPSTHPTSIRTGATPQASAACASASWQSKATRGFTVKSKGGRRRSPTPYTIDSLVDDFSDIRPWFSELPRPESTWTCDTLEQSKQTLAMHRSKQWRPRWATQST